jgi:protein-disulfide isomerase
MLNVPGACIEAPTDSLLRVTSSAIARCIDRDPDTGERSGVEGTPTFYVNGIRHNDGYGLESLRPAGAASMQGFSKAH